MLGLAEVPNVKWEDIGGLEDVKAEILEAVSNIGVVGSKRYNSYFTLYQRHFKKKLAF